MPLLTRDDAQPPTITKVEEYDGQPAVIVAATQLDYAGYTATQQKRIVAEWVEFFSAGPSPIVDLEFCSRTPKRLFDALASQTQLERLYVKWGDYASADALADMDRLRSLTLLGASGLTDIAALSRLQSVTRLIIESLRRLPDLSPIGAMHGVVDLVLGGDWHSPRNAHVDSIGFLSRMPQLRTLSLHTIIVDDLDYSPVLALPNLESVHVKKVRGMRPSHEELQAATPWSRSF